MRAGPRATISPTTPVGQGAPSSSTTAVSKVRASVPAEASSSGRPSGSWSSGRSTLQANVSVMPYSWKNPQPNTAMARFSTSGAMGDAP